MVTYCLQALGVQHASLVVSHGSALSSPSDVCIQLVCGDENSQTTSRASQEGHTVPLPRHFVFSDEVMCTVPSRSPTVIGLGTSDIAVRVLILGCRPRSSRIVLSLLELTVSFEPVQHAPLCWSQVQLKGALLLSASQSELPLEAHVTSCAVVGQDTIWFTARHRAGSPPNVYAWTLPSQKRSSASSVHKCIAVKTSARVDLLVSSGGRVCGVGIKGSCLAVTLWDGARASMSMVTLCEIATILHVFMTANNHDDVICVVGRDTKMRLRVFTVVGTEIFCDTSNASPHVVSNVVEINTMRVIGVLDASHIVVVTLDGQCRPTVLPLSSDACKESTSQQRFVEACIPRGSATENDIIQKARWTLSGDVWVTITEFLSYRLKDLCALRAVCVASFEATSSSWKCALLDTWGAEHAVVEEVLASCRARHFLTCLATNKECNRLSFRSIVSLRLDGNAKHQVVLDMSNSGEHVLTAIEDANGGGQQIRMWTNRVCTSTVALSTHQAVVCGVVGGEGTFAVVSIRAQLLLLRPGVKEPISLTTGDDSSSRGLSSPTRDWIKRLWLDDDSTTMVSLSHQGVIATWNVSDLGSLMVVQNAACLHQYNTDVVPIPASQHDQFGNRIPRDGCLRFYIKAVNSISEVTIPLPATTDGTRPHVDALRRLPPALGAMQDCDCCASCTTFRSDRGLAIVTLSPQRMTTMSRPSETISFTSCGLMRFTSHGAAMVCIVVGTRYSLHHHRSSIPEASLCHGSLLVFDAATAQLVDELELPEAVVQVYCGLDRSVFLVLTTHSILCYRLGNHPERRSPRISLVSVVTMWKDEGQVTRIWTGISRCRQHVNLFAQRHSHISTHPLKL